jgi:hypothetical protein
METNDLYEAWRALHLELDYLPLLNTSWDGRRDPFLPELEVQPSVRRDYDNDPTWQYEMSLHSARRDLCQRFSWAVPSPCVIARLAEFGPILEVGAGLGYWAKCIRDAGGDIVPTDRQGWPRIEENSWHKEAERHTDVLVFDAVEAVRQFSDKPRALMLVWPPYSSDMAEEATMAYLRLGGQTVIYVGEQYGCTATDRYERLLHLVFDESCEEHAIPQWGGIHDYVRIFRR